MTTLKKIATAIRRLFGTLALIALILFTSYIVYLRIFNNLDIFQVDVIVPAALFALCALWGLQRSDNAEASDVKVTQHQKITDSERFKELPNWAKLYALHAKVVKIIVFMIPFLIGFFFGTPTTGAVISVMLLASGFRLIPSSPILQAAIPQILEVRIPKVYRSGFTFVIPFLEKLLFIPVNDIDADWEFTNIPTRLHSLIPEDSQDPRKDMADVLKRFDKVSVPDFGGQVTVGIQYSITPDQSNAWSLIDILNKNGVVKATGFLQGIVNDDIRQAGAALTWRQIKFSSDLVSIFLIDDLTGKRKLPNGVDVFDEPTGRNIKEFMSKVLTNGISDINGSGFKINTLNITSVEAEGKLKDAVDLVPVELEKSKQLGVNSAALRSNINIIKGENPDGSINDDGALAALQAEDGTVEHTRRTINLSNADMIAGKIADGLKTWLAKQ